MNNKVDTKKFVWAKNPMGPKKYWARPISTTINL